MGNLDPDDVLYFDTYFLDQVKMVKYGQSFWLITLYFACLRFNLKYRCLLVVQYTKLNFVFKRIV